MNRMNRLSRALPHVMLLAALAACSEAPTSVPGPEASLDMGPSLGVYPAVNLLPPQADAPDAPLGNGLQMSHAAGGILNASFETGNFSGWTVAVVPNAPLIPWRVDGAGVGSGYGMSLTSPVDGSEVAWNGFDGGGPLHFSMYQDVTIPAGKAELSWHFRAQWRYAGYGGNASQPRTVDVQVRDPGTNAVIATLHSFSTGTQAENPTGDTGWQAASGIISGLGGQVVRIYVDEYIPQNFTGPGQIEFDHFSLVALDPTTKDECKNGGWEQFGFRNQGQCVRFVETGKDSR